MIYQIREWPRFFENDRSRQVERCSYLVSPNKQHGVGFSYIMSEKDGAAVYGIFKLMAGAVSQQQTLPREGWLTDDGTKDGRPWTVEDMALRWRREPSEVARAIEILSSERVNWLCAHSRPGHVELTADSRPTHPEGRKEGREGKKERTDSSEFAKSRDSEPPSPILLVFPTMGRLKSWDLTQAQVDQWRELYPALDVLGECRQALAWVKAKQRKTHAGMPAFLVNWFNRSVARSPCARNDGLFGQPLRGHGAKSMGDLGMGEVKA